MAIDITQQVNQIATDAARAAAQQLEARVAALETQAAPVVAVEAKKDIPLVSTALVTTVQNAAKNAEHDVWLPRMVVGALSAAGLAILIGIEAGSHQAQDVWAALVPIVLAVAGVAGRMVVTTAAGPKPPTPGA